MSSRPVAASARAARRRMWSRLVLAQHVVDEVGGDRELAARLFLAGKPLLDQSGDDRAGAEGALHQRRFREPGLQIVAQHVLVEQLREREIAAADAPARHRPGPTPPAHIRWRQSRADATARARAGALAACRASGARGGPRTDSRQDSIWRRAERFRPAGRRPRQQRTPFLDLEPFAHLFGQARASVRLGQHGAHAGGEISRERKFAAFIGRYFRIGRVGARDIDLVLDQRLVSEDFAGEHEGVAGRQRLDEIFLDLAEQPAAARDRPCRGARERTSRTLSMSASTMVPTFMR